MRTTTFEWHTGFKKRIPNSPTLQPLLCARTPSHCTNVQMALLYICTERPFRSVRTFFPCTMYDVRGDRHRLFAQLVHFLKNPMSVLRHKKIAPGRFLYYPTQPYPTGTLTLTLNRTRRPPTPHLIAIHHIITISLPREVGSFRAVV